MILTKLAVEYECLVAQGKLERPGWSPVGVTYALELDADGSLMAVQSLRVTNTILDKNKNPKTVTRPRAMTVPAPAKRSSGIAPNFLCDNSTYFLGINDKGKTEQEKAKNKTRAVACFQASREHHHELLDSVDSVAAQAICRFFDTWNPAEAAENSVLKPYLEGILKGGNLVFSVEDVYAQDDPAIREAWQRRYDSGEGETVMQCLDTGKEEPIAILHPNIKGIRNAKPTGASLVSFNAPAYESYGCREAQGRNAPVSKYTAFAYGAALNYLLADRDRVQVIGDTTVVCWAEGGSPAYQDLFCESLSDGNVQSVVKKLAHGEAADLHNIRLGPEEPFYVLGLAPNAARASICFFWQGTFEEFAQNIDAHYERLEIKRPLTSQGKRSVWGLLQETVNQKASDKTPKSKLVKELLQAILTNGRYPETLLQAVEIRIRADHVINWRRAAILKAVLMQNYKNQPDIQEAAQMELNKNCKYPPYVLGRIFCLYEWIQKRANPDITTTIRDRYFNSAAATPAVVFGLLGKLCQNHLRKLKPDARGFFQKELTERFDLLDEPIPARLSLQDQATFQIGYYHQMQELYTPRKKDE